MQLRWSWSVPSEQEEQDVESVCEAVLQLFAKKLEIYIVFPLKKKHPPRLYSFHAELKEVNLGFLSAEVEAWCSAV